MEPVDPERRQLLLATRALLAVAAASLGVAGWNAYRDFAAQRRSARGRRRKWKWGLIALLWAGLAYWSEHRSKAPDDQRSSSS